MISAAQLAALKPGDVVTVRCVVLSADRDHGDALKVRTGAATVCGTTYYAPLDQIDGVEKGNGDVPRYPPVERGFLATLSDDAAADLHAEARLDALCGSVGRVIDIAA